MSPGEILANLGSSASAERSFTVSGPPAGAFFGATDMKESDPAPSGRVILQSGFVRAIF